MWNKYYSVATVAEALDVLDQEQKNIKIIAGGTDLILEMKQGLHENVNSLVDISRIQEINNIQEDNNGYIHIGAGVTHNQCLESELLRKYAFPLVQACYGVGTPQIRNVATIAGNLATASPANDSIPPLIAMNAELKLRSKTSTRTIKLADFYKGVRSIDLRPNEMIVEIILRKLDLNQKGIFKRYILRSTHSISVVNTSIVLTLEGNHISNAVITIGCVAPIIVRAKEAEEFLKGKLFDTEVIEKVSALSLNAISPISDIRATDKYRRRLVKILIADGLYDLIKDQEKKDIPEKPIFLSGKNKLSKNFITKSFVHTAAQAIQLSINQKKYQMTGYHDGLLADLIREGAGLTGTKIGCGEGECGACTVTMDGLSVFSCLIPAPRAHGTEILTIEGIGSGEKLHPVQEAYIQEGAIQCGFCTPGFIMSSIQLLEEVPKPSKKQIQEGLSGNLCRCTGYYRIIAAVEKAAEKMNG